MSRDEILAMEPGYILNELIAEKIMDIPVSAKKAKFEWVHVPSYSNDISAAWEVVKKMRKIGFDVAIESLNDTLECGGDLHHVRFFKRIEGDYGEYDSEKSFTHAICIAALAAIGTNESAQPKAGAV